jgi:predicted 2-oxoglutarate/Fe(II)-dependent dioxygenase YbiX
VSIVIFLSRESAQPVPGAYCGGSLVFHDDDADPRQKSRGFPLIGEPGLLVAFRSDTTHEVTPVTYGERYSIVCWYR